MLLKNKDASAITLRNQNRTLYANYVVQKNRADNGCKLSVTLENGGTGEASILTKIKQGEQETTVSERDNYISQNSCPILVQPTLNPYASDKIYLALTTSASAYTSASSGSWVPITATEYTAVQTTVANTSYIGLSSNLFTSGPYSSSGYTFQNLFVANTSNASLTPTVPANNYLFAFAMIMRNTLSVAITDFNVYTNDSTSTYSNFSLVGNSALPSVVGGRNYYVLKGVSNVRASTEGILGVSLPGNGANSNSQSWNLVYSSSATGTRFRLNNGVTLPITPSSSMPSFGSVDWSIAIQGLATPTIQWLT